MEDNPPQNHPPAPRTRVLKLERNCCTACVRRVKRAMLKAEGVHSIKINANEGTIEVTSDIDPRMLVEMAAKAGRRAELLWETEPEPRPDIPPPVAASSANRPQVHVSNFDQTISTQDLLDKNARVIKHMTITDKRVTKIAFNNETRVSSVSDQPPDSPSPIPPQSIDSGGGGEAALPPPAEAEPLPSIPIPIPPEIRDVPAEPPLANVNCSNGRNTSCRVM